MDYKHQALNLLTGEVISCKTGNALKRSAAYIATYEPTKWVFAHGRDFRPDQYHGAPYLTRKETQQ